MRLSKLILLCVSLVLVTTPSFSDNQARLSKQLAYLKKIPEISEVIIYQNDIYIGFTTVPADMCNIVRDAAILGTSAYGYRIHVWGCLYDKNMPDPKMWKYYCLSTGQDGNTRLNIFARKFI